MKKPIIKSASIILSLFKYISVLFFTQIILISCAGRLLIPEYKWKTKHIVYIKTNQKNVTVRNKKGEKLEQQSDGDFLSVYVDKLRRKNLNLTLSNPNRVDTTIKIERVIRVGALIFDCTLGAALYGIPLIWDFANTNIYQVKKSSRNLIVNMLYNNLYLEQQFLEARKKGNIAAYEEFLEKYPDTKFATRAQDSIYILAWNNALRKNNINEFNNFITKYSKASHVSDAQNKIYDIAFNEALMTNNRDAFEKYIAYYPKSPRFSDALRIIEKFKEIDDAYNKAITIDSFKLYRNFFNTYEKTKYDYLIAEKMISAYCKENLSKIIDLNVANDAYAFLNNIRVKYNILAICIPEIRNKRDFFIAEVLKKNLNRKEYEILMAKQFEMENLNYEKGDRMQILDRILTNSQNIKLSGKLNFWNKNNEKEIISYYNGLKSGPYIKFATDEKTILEKGFYSNNLKHGYWTIFFNDKLKKSEEEWVNNQLINQRIFDSDGKVKFEKGTFYGYFNSYVTAEPGPVETGGEVYFTKFSGFLPSKKQLIFKDDITYFETLVDSIEKLLGNLEILKKYRLKVTWIYEEDNGTMHDLSTYCSIQSVAFDSVSLLNFKKEFKATLEFKRKREEEAKIPKSGFNYWVSHDVHECECCYNNYNRIIIKYTSSEVAAKHDPFGYAEWFNKTLENNVLGLLSASKKKPFFLYKPAKENCGRKGCKVKCGY